MKNRKSILVLVLGLLVILAMIGFYHGIFKTIEVKEQEEAAYTFIGLEFRGPYAETGKHITEVVEKLKNYGTTGELSFGIYYDDPKKVKSGNCRSYVGIVLPERDQRKIPTLLAAGFKVDSIGLKKSLQAEFPIKNSFSYIIGPWKTYPVLNKYMKEKNYQADLTIEIYDIRNRKIVFLIRYH